MTYNIIMYIIILWYLTINFIKFHAFDCFFPKLEKSKPHESDANNVAISFL